MKAIIYRQETAHNGIYRTAVYFFGICVFVWESPDEAPKRHKPVGFIQYPSEAPTEIEADEFFPDEEF